MHFYDVATQLGLVHRIIQFDGHRCLLSSTSAPLHELLINIGVPVHVLMLSKKSCEVDGLPGEFVEEFFPVLLDLRSGRQTFSDNCIAATSGRLHAAVIALPGSLYMIGGMSDGGAPCDYVSRFDAVNDHWEELAPLPTPRYNCAAVALQSCLYVIGTFGKVLIQTCCLHPLHWLDYGASFQACYETKKRH